MRTLLHLSPRLDTRDVASNARIPIHHEPQHRFLSCQMSLSDCVAGGLVYPHAALSVEHNTRAYIPIIVRLRDA